MVEAVREADDAARIRATIAPFSPFPGLLVITLSGLAAARRAAGPGAPPIALLEALDGLTGGDGSFRPAMGAGRHAQESAACRIFVDIRAFAASGTSVAYVRDGAIMVNATRMTGIVRRALDREGGALHAARTSLDLVALHELGHVAQHAMGHEAPGQDFAGVPGHVEVERLAPGVRRAGAPLDGVRVPLRSAVRWHARECYADAFQVGASLARGISAEDAMGEVSDGTARFCERGFRAFLDGDPFWSKNPLWPGIYCTVAAAAAVLREPPLPGAGAAEIADVARRAMRRGVLTPEMMSEVALRDGAPDWLPGLDPTGRLGDAIARADLPTCLPHRSAPYEADATDAVMGTIAAASLSPRSETSEGAVTAAVRRWCGEVLEAVPQIRRFAATP